MRGEPLPRSPGRLPCAVLHRWPMPAHGVHERIETIGTIDPRPRCFWPAGGSFNVASGQWPCDEKIVRSPGRIGPGGVFNQSRRRRRVPHPGLPRVPVHERPVPLRTIELRPVP